MISNVPSDLWEIINRVWPEGFYGFGIDTDLSDSCQNNNSETTSECILMDSDGSAGSDLTANQYRY